MKPIYAATFNEVMVGLVTEQVIEQLSREELGRGMDLVVVKLAESMEKGRYSIEEFLQGRGVHSKILGILGINSTAQAVACQARVKFRMEILYHDAHPAPEVERACAARLVPFAEVLRQADFICIALPLSHETEQQMGRQPFSAGQAQAIFLAWQSV